MRAAKQHEHPETKQLDFPFGQEPQMFTFAHLSEEKTNLQELLKPKKEEPPYTFFIPMIADKLLKMIFYVLN